MVASVSSFCKFTRRLGLLTLAGVVSLTLVACGTTRVEDYADNRPLLQPEQFFDGHLSAHGVIKNRSGEVIRYFNATIDAHWEAGVGVLEEEFLFSDGEQQTRIWQLRPRGDNRYTGTAGDVIGEADIQVAGNSMFLDYVLRTPYGDGTIDLRIDDRMYLVSDTVLLNESVLSKFGVRVGTMLLVIRKHESKPQALTERDKRETARVSLTGWSDRSAATEAIRF